MFNQVKPTLNFPELEGEVTKFWKDNSIFEKSISNRNSNNKYIFYDGPPFITGTPHYGSLLPSIAKDVIPRYQTMKGHQVARVWGWDCHGLPIETKVEKALDIKNKKDIEKFGIQKFIDECYKYTRSTSSEWKWYIDKIGRWVDFDNSYKTMDQDYMETVMWSFKNLFDKKMVYEGTRTSLFCTRCGTPISNFEIAMDNSYADMEDPAVTIKFPVLTKGKFEGMNILAWTTTPWTLPSNKALVLDPKEDYVIAKVKRLDIELEKVWLVNKLPENINKVKKANITQAYLENYKDDSGMEIHNARIRKMDNDYSFTVKYFAGSTTETGQQIEKTEQITKEKYIELIKQATKKVVKTRYYFPLDNALTAEIDMYQNELQGLNVVEVEFPSISKEKNFKKPEWFGKEVTDSEGVYPPIIAGKTFEDVNKINEGYTQAPHNYEAHAIEENVILAKKRIDYVLANMDFEIVSTFKGKELVGLKYKPPFNYFDASEKEHQVYSFEGMVTMEEGTGVVHSAPGFGDVDTEMGKHYGLSIAMSINDEGKYYDFITDYKRLYVKEADKYIMADLTKSGILFKQEKIVHRYPFCYRCTTPLLQKAQPSWFVDVQGIKENLIENNENINWVPQNLKHGRFKKGIETAPDWCVSRTRYWATPMPIWQREENGKVVERMVLGSRDEIRANSVQPITKVLFVRHAEKSGHGPDAVLSETGKVQAQGLAMKYEKEKFDNIYSSEHVRARETVVPLAKLQSKNVLTSKALGCVEFRQEQIDIVEKLKKDPTFTKLSEVSEEVLKKEFAKLIAETKVELDKFLTEIKGQYVIAATHKEAMALIRHLIEGRNLQECFALDMDNVAVKDLYLNGTELMDLHRPKIDGITLKGKTGELTRVKEVLDVWMDSASMPYASKHYPFEEKKDFEDNFPADFVIEYIAQTRAWFYVMHVLGTALFKQNPFKNVVTTGVIFGTDGRKMSKSYGNYPDPKIVLEKYGAEPLRLYLMGAPVMVGEDINLEEEALKVQTRDFFLPLWNCYSFFITYANIHNWKAPKNIELSSITNELDKWILLKLQNTIKLVTTNYDKYNLPAVVKEYKSFISELSKWYIRRSREKFNSNDEQSLTTLYKVLMDFSKLLAPMSPFISEEIYKNLVSADDKDAQESIHLCDFPVVDKKFVKENEGLLEKMEFVRNVVELGQSIRAQKGLKVRQALSELQVKVEEKELKIDSLDSWMIELIVDELNVKKVLLVKNINKAEGWELTVSEDKKISISLDTNLTKELIEDGIYREIVRGIQNQRKKTGLSFGQTIKLELGTTDEQIEGVIKGNLEQLKKDIDADSIKLTSNILQWDVTIKINSSELMLKIILD
jgi:isoleucyl-tRNA synthetase